MVRIILFIISFYIFTVPMSSGWAGSVLLTIDVEQTGDPENLSSLSIDVPATYFFLGEFAKANFEIVQELARNNSIGAHGYSHESMKGMPEAVVEAELLLTKIMLSEAAGRPVKWFRAPFLKTDDVVKQKLNELGYVYDSTEIENWAEEGSLFNLPISSAVEGGLLISDYDIFEKTKMNNSQAIEFLKREYRTRDRINRPLVILLHPSIIIRHMSVLDEFIAFVKQQDGRFFTVDQWSKHYTTPAKPRVGVWLDLSVGIPDLEKLNDNLAAIGATDVFLMAKDHDGFSYVERDHVSDAVSTFALIHEELKKTRVKVHAWLPILLNPAYVQLYPDRGMRRADGERSLSWMSPYDTEVLSYLIETIDDLLSRFSLDGIHLDYIRYPDLEHDFSKTLLDGFSAKYPDKTIDPSVLRSELYTEWIIERKQVIGNVVERIKEMVERHETVNHEIELSAALIAEGAVSAQARNKFGQDYAQLAESLDIVIPMAYFKSELRPLEWIRRIVFSTRYLIGDTPLFTGLLGYQQPRKWKLTDRELGKSINLGTESADGVVFYNYMNLFGEGEETSWNMPESSISAIKKALDSLGQPVRPKVETPLTSLSNDVVTDEKLGMASKREYGPAHAILLIGFMAILGFVFYVIKRNGMHYYDLSPSTLSDGLMDLSANHLQQLDVRIEGSRNIENSLFIEVTRLLNSLGANKITYLRQVQILDLIHQGWNTPSQLVEELAGQLKAPRVLRQIEEMALLEYIEITEKGNIKNTNYGEETLAKAPSEGYSRELLSFIDRRLSEDIIMTCPTCASRTAGQWFWNDFECSVCHRKSCVAEAANIYVSKKASNSLLATPPEMHAISHQAESP